MGPDGSMQTSTLPPLACVNVPTLPLQLLLRRHPEWTAFPVAVVAEDRPYGEILWVNGHARRSGIVPGLRYATGLALSSTLRAGAVAQGDITTSAELISILLRCFTPGIELSTTEAGIFWLDATGVSSLYGSQHAWAQGVYATLRDNGFRSTIVVGFSRFGTYAVARARDEVVVFSTTAHEQAAVRGVPLASLGLNPVLREDLAKLGIQTVAEFLQLPPAGLRERFGVEAYRLYRWAVGEQEQPRQLCVITDPPQHTVTLETPETNATRLLFAVKRGLYPLLTQLTGRHEALAELQLQLALEGYESTSEHIRSAVPTLDARQLLDLVRMRLESLTLTAGVVALRLTAVGVPATTEQLQLFLTQQRRDPTAANRALARLRAAFGDDAVVRVRLRDAHLPEARFAWEPLDQILCPQPRVVAKRPLIRRLFAHPVLLPSPSRDLRAQEWMADGLEGGPIIKIVRSGIISGGWWRREVQREYHFIETARGDVLWVFYDRRRRQWRCQGRVE